MSRLIATTNEITKVEKVQTQQLAFAKRLTQAMLCFDTFYQDKTRLKNSWLACMRIRIRIETLHHL